MCSHMHMRVCLARSLTCAPALGTQFLGSAAGFVDMVTTHFPSPAAAARTKLAHTCARRRRRRRVRRQQRQTELLRAARDRYTGSLVGGPLARGMLECDHTGPLVINSAPARARTRTRSSLTHPLTHPLTQSLAVVKLLAASDGLSFYAFGRILSGAPPPPSPLHYHTRHLSPCRHGRARRLRARARRALHRRGPGGRGRRDRRWRERGPGAVPAGGLARVRGVLVRARARASFSAAAVAVLLRLFLLLLRRPLL